MDTLSTLFALNRDFAAANVDCAVARERTLAARRDGDRALAQLDLAEAQEALKRMEAAHQEMLAALKRMEVARQRMYALFGRTPPSAPEPELPKPPLRLV